MRPLLVRFELLTTFELPPGKFVRSLEVEDIPLNDDSRTHPVRIASFAPVISVDLESEFLFSFIFDST